MLKKKRDILAIAAVLVLMVTFLFIKFPVLADEIVYLPIISGSTSNTNSANASEKPILVDILITPVWDESVEAPISRVREQEEELKEALAGQPQEFIYVGGPETRGALIEIAGKQLQLPPDAQMDGEVVTGFCSRKSCIEPPFYLISRNEERAILKHDGSIYRGATEMTRDDYDANFAFMIDVLGPFKDVEAGE